MRRYNFFDMDGTLTRRDTFTGFIWHVHGPWGFAKVMMRSAWAILLWKTGRISNVDAKLRMFATAFGGMQHARLAEMGESYADVIDRMTRPEVLAELERGVAEEAETAIVSASMALWIAPWARRHGVNRVIATLPEIDPDGCLTGRFATPNCEKEEKVRRIREAYPELGEQRADCCVSAWGDSDSDTPMLNFADRGFRVGSK